MKTTLLATLFIALIFNGIAQIFPKDSTEWSISFTDFNLPPNGGYITKTYHFALYGDTNIQNFEYSKLYKDTLSSDSFFIFSHSQLIGFIRDDTSKQVFLRDTNSTERLIFDFSLHVGDTFSPLSPNGVVTGIDSIFIDNAYRKHFIIDPGLALWPLEYVEGVGYLSGQGVFSNWLYLNIGIHKSFQLLCLRDKGTIIYNIGSCYIDESTVQTGIDEMTQINSKVIVYPNPFSSSTIVLTKIELKNGDLIIFDIHGQEIKKIKNIHGQQILINRSGLISGIYFYQLKEENEIISTGKLIAE